jgi:hypothetical protein
MTNLMSCFKTPIVYKPINIGESNFKGLFGKKEHIDRLSNIGDFHIGEPKDLLSGSNSINDDSHGGKHSGFLDGSNSHSGNHNGLLGGVFGSNADGKENSSGIFGGGNSPSGQPVENQVINGTVCNDTLRGNNYGSDTLVGTTDVARGVGEHDILIGGNARDTFVLGDVQGSLYLGKGNVDYAEIHNFSRCNDLIQLAGSAQDYSISYANGISSVYHKDACGCMDLVAQVDSACSPLDLNAKYFQYVTQCAGSPVLMG